MRSSFCAKRSRNAMRPRIAFNREAFPKAARRRARTPKASRNLLRCLPFLLLIRNQETSAKVFTEANEQNKDLVILQRVAKKLGLKFRPPLSSSTDFDRRSEAPAENPSVIRVARRFVAWCKRIAIKNQQEQRPRVRASIRIGIRGLLAPPDCKGFRSRSLSPHSCLFVVKKTPSV